MRMFIRGMMGLLLNRNHAEKGAACVEALSKNVRRSRWFNLSQRMSQYLLLSQRAGF